MYQSALRFLVPIFLLYSIRLRKKPIFLLFQLPITTPLVIRNKRTTFIQRIIIRRRQSRHIYILILHVYRTPPLLLLLRTNIGVITLTVPRLFHIARLLCGCRGQAGEEFVSVFFASIRGDREVVREDCGTSDGRWAYEGVADAAEYHFRVGGVRRSRGRPCDGRPALGAHWAGGAPFDRTGRHYGRRSGQVTPKIQRGAPTHLSPSMSPPLDRSRPKTEETTR